MNETNVEVTSSHLNPQTAILSEVPFVVILSLLRQILEQCLSLSHSSFVPNYLQLKIRYLFVYSELPTAPLVPQTVEQSRIGGATEASGHGLFHSSALGCHVEAEGTQEDPLSQQPIRLDARHFRTELTLPISTILCWNISLLVSVSLIDFASLNVFAFQLLPAGCVKALIWHSLVLL